MTNEPVELSPLTVERRLREVVALNALCDSLFDAGRRAGLHALVAAGAPQLEGGLVAAPEKPARKGKR